MKAFERQRERRVCMNPVRYHSIADRYIDSVYKAALSCCKNRADADDAVQNAFLKLLKTDKDTMPIYFRDEKKYIVASTDPDQQLNLYDDIDKAPHAKIENDWLLIDHSFLLDGVETPDDPDELYRYLAFSEPYSDRINLGCDMDDGIKDGVLKRDIFDYETYVVSPEGLIISAFKSTGTMMDDDEYATIWGLIWGEETQESFEEYIEAYRDSDGSYIVD